ncbi:VWA domain-containing protein [Bifidobacterium pseudolongum]|uniref:vWA domain-containing protein n=1 Tax=Bifidobacterium pseudolongum TaxID=1694 RepID=UPI001F0FFD7E|nr:vWA domain-containing protein [Bifidobacterium pseudolongum]MCH4853844.1 VWA domain-containing protein [Bifidobacterium pseudolongum]
MRGIQRFEPKHGADEPRSDAGRFTSRLVAAFVAVATTIGLAGVGVAAYGEDSADQGQPVTATESQGVAAAAEGVDAPQHAKRISKNDDGTYTLSMDVTGKSSESTEQQVVPLDIALVLDVSGSMDEPVVDGSSTTRLQALQGAVTEFLGQVKQQNERIDDDTKKVQVALVKYAGESSDTIGNQTYCGKSFLGICMARYNYSQTVHSLAWNPTELDQEIVAVNALQAGGATQANFGLQHAVTQLNSGVNSGREGVQKLTIFYSDGSPTSSSDFEPAVANSAIATAAQLKTKTSQVISIGAMSGANPDGTDNANRFMNYVSSNYPTAQSMSAPGKRGPGDYYYAVNAETDLQTIFDKIISIVTSGTAYQDVTMTDTLSNYVEFSQPDAQNFGATLVIRDKNSNTVQPADVGLTGYTINVKPGSKTISISFPQGYALKDGYTYSLEYKIVPSAKAYEDYAANANAGTNGYGGTKGDAGTGDSSEYQQGFRSNEEATIDYTPRVDGEPQTPVKGTKYPHPVIQVDTTQFAKLSIHKAWIATNPEPDKVTVDVSCQASGKDCTGYAGIDITKSNDFWTSTVLIPKAGVDRTYTVTEHALSGFRTYYTNREIKIDANTAGEYRSTVTNYPAAINFNLNQISVGKTVQGTDTDQDFTFTLSPVNAEGAVAGDKPFTGAELTLADRFTNGTQVTGAFADTSITLPTPEAGQEATYTFKVEENAPTPSAGWAVDTDEVTVTVTVGAPTAEGTIPTTVTYHYAADDADGTEANKNLAAFTNHWIAVSQLPLTGEGGATPLLWLVIGGGLGALALLTAGGVAVWRKRRLI